MQTKKHGKFKIGIVTPGGDAPGTNAAIWAATKTAEKNGLPIIGIKWGYRGIVDNDLLEEEERLESIAWGNISRGGTILRTVRYKIFEENEIRKKAAKNLIAKGIHNLIVIGGDGSLRGALLLRKMFSELREVIHIVFIPATIDNDVNETGFSIGFDSAVNVALEEIEKVRDHAESTGRILLVEVMGREVGLIALETGLAVRAEAILVRERITKTKTVKKAYSGKSREEIIQYDFEDWNEYIWNICKKLERKRLEGIKGRIIVVAESISERVNGGIGGLGQKIEDNLINLLTIKQLAQNEKSSELSQNLENISWKDSNDILKQKDPGKKVHDKIKKDNERNPLWEIRHVVLGHVQRGGAPTAFSRNLAFRMGVRAVELLQDEQKIDSSFVKMIAMQRNEIKIIDIENFVNIEKLSSNEESKEEFKRISRTEFNTEIYTMAKMLGA